MSKTQISASGGTGTLEKTGNTPNVGTLYDERGMCMIMEIWREKSLNSRGSQVPA